MSLSSDLISQFVKITKDDTKVKSETTVYGTVVYDGRIYVKLDGSDLLTPVSTTADVKDGERVTVMIKDHTATVTGNISSPAARTKDVDNVATQVSEFGTVVSHKVTTDDLQATNAIIDKLIAVTGKYSELEAITAEIETLRAEFIEGKSLIIEDVEAITATIESIEAKFGDFENISVEDLEAINAEITNLKGYTADFTYISAVKASIKDLEAEKLSAKDANLQYVNIDFANVDQAWFDLFYAESGMVKDLTIDEGVVVKELIGVTISGDLIQANTIKADQIVVRGSDGNYYKLSTDFSTMEGVTPVEEDTLHGSMIVKNSIAAEKINVSDLKAFDATIGGFKITDNAIHSLVKGSVDNTTQGVYLDSEGQMVVGDNQNYLKYYKNPDGDYVFRMQLKELLIDGKNAAGVLGCIEINPGDNSIKLGSGNNAMSLTLTNEGISFEKDGNRFGWWDGVDFQTGNIKIDVTERAQFGNFAMVPRSDGSLSFLKVQNNVGVYALIAGGVVTLHGAYPMLENTTLVISDVSAELVGTTLIIGG